MGTRMDRIRSIFIEKAWVRWLALILLLAVGACSIMTPDERARLTNDATSLIGWR